MHLENIFQSGENPFIGKSLRCFYDEPAQKWWFSAVDICAVLTDSDYNAARRYWKRQKNEFKNRKGQLARESDQLKLPAANGKYYFTDVLDIREIIYLIQIIPSPKTEPFRLWLADMVVNNTNIETLLAEAGAEDAKQIEAHARNAGVPYVRHTIKRKEIPLPDCAQDNGKNTPLEELK